jgi:hypothetical protein
MERSTAAAAATGRDEVIREVRAVREELAARHDYDVRALYEAAKERQQESKRKVVSLKPRHAEPAKRSA